MVAVPVEELFGVWKLWGALFALGFHGSWVWDLHILHGPPRRQDRSTTVRLLRAMLGLGGPFEVVVGVDPGCAAPGSAGGPHLRFCGERGCWGEG